MADFAVTVQKIFIKPHNNADTLELGNIGSPDGWQVVVKRGLYQSGDLVVYIGENSVVPEWVLKAHGFWNDIMGVGMLAGKLGNRVKAIRLRGEFSLGICLPVDLGFDNDGDYYFIENETDRITFAKNSPNHLSWEDMEFSVFLGISKYEPPIPTQMAGEVYNAGTAVTANYDVENIKNWTDVIEEGEEVQITEKLHGTLCQLICIPYTGVGVDASEHLLLRTGTGVGYIAVASKGMGAQGLCLKHNEANKNNVYLRATRPYLEGVVSGLTSLKVKAPVVILGEVFGCLAYNTPILLKDGTTERIGRIVSRKLSIEVLSYNTNTGEVEPKKVIGYKRQKCRDPNEWLKLSFKRRGKRGRGTNIVATKNHIFFTEGFKEIRAEELKVGNTVYLHSGGKYSYEQEQIILGGLLGDSSMNDYMVKFNHSEKQKEYLLAKYKMFPTFSSKVSKRISGFVSNMSLFSTNSIHNKTSVDFGDLCYKNGNKVITKKWLDRLGPLGMAVWYMDDGTLAQASGKTDKCVLCTNGFSLEEVLIILDFFIKKGIDCYKIKQKTGYTVCFSPDGSKAFQSIIAPFIHSSMKYKLSKSYQLQANNWENLYKITNIPGVIKTVVEKIISGSPYNNSYMDKYDIEVEGNHNFFANNILVHNSGIQDLTYGMKNSISFRVFDIYIGRRGQGRYLDHSELDQWCADLGLERVPLLYLGAFEKDLLERYQGTKSVYDSNQVREGIVIKPVNERLYPELGRVMLKSINEAYLLRKGSTTEFN